MTATTLPSQDPLIRAFEGASHVWVLVLLGIVAVGLGVIVLVAAWYRMPGRAGRHGPEQPETP